MKQSKRVLNKLNDLLIMNYEAERIYLEALETVEGEHLKNFFRDRGFERNEFGRMLRSEIKNVGGKPNPLDNLSNNFYKIWVRFKELLEMKREPELLEEVCHVKRISIDAYDELLQTVGLPLSTCKLLVEQRDNLQDSMHIIKTKETLVA